MESEGDNRTANKSPPDSQTPSAYQDWASAVQVYYPSGTAAAPGNPQMFYSSPPIPPFVWGPQPTTYGSKLPHNPIFTQAAPSASILSLGGTAGTLERESKLMDGDLENGDKRASGSDTGKESGGEEFSKTSRDDKKRLHEDFRGMRNEYDDKRQKRKQSNRESARRSRERRQKECEILGRQVADLNSLNADLRSEIDQLHAECKRVGAENASIMEELKKLYGPGALTALGVD